MPEEGLQFSKNLFYILEYWLRFYIEIYYQKMFEKHEFDYSPPFTQKETVKQVRKCTFVTSLGLQLPRAEGQAARSYDTLFPLDFRPVTWFSKLVVYPSLEISFVGKTIFLPAYWI